MDYWVGCYAPAFFGLFLGIVAAVRGWKDRGKLRAKEKRLEQIAHLVSWWRENGQGEDYRGQDAMGPLEVLDAVERMASKREFSRRMEPRFFHECGCPIWEKRHRFRWPWRDCCSVLERPLSVEWHKLEGAPAPPGELTHSDS